MRVLISAYACEPGKASEPAVGWNWVREIARFHEVWVITRANNRKPIESAVANEVLRNVHWVYYDLPRWVCIWKKGKWGVYPYYYLWQVATYFVARGLQRKLRFDLTHHVTFVNYWIPSFLALLPVPFIWGPVGGGESAPYAFMTSFSLRGKVFELLRELIRRLGEFNPFMRLTSRRTALGIATTEETAVRLREVGCKKVLVVSQVALPRHELNQLNAFPIRHTNPFRLVSIGNLLHWKGFNLGIRAFGQFQSQFPTAEYWIIGDGPERKRLEKLARGLRVAKSITFWGALPREKVLEKLAQCDALVHPSLHDSGGYVCSEAMAAGRPVICLDVGGPAVQVTQETGFEVHAVTPDQTIQDIALALGVLAAHHDLRIRMGQAGRSRVREQFSMENKVNFIANLYELVRSA